MMKSKRGMKLFQELQQERDSQYMTNNIIAMLVIVPITVVIILFVSGVIFTPIGVLLAFILPPLSYIIANILLYPAKEYYGTAESILGVDDDEFVLVHLSTITNGKPQKAEPNSFWILSFKSGITLENGRNIFSLSDCPKCKIKIIIKNKFLPQNIISITKHSDKRNIEYEFNMIAGYTLTKYYTKLYALKKKINDKHN